jgi:16S rRNA (guanine966-N2)-methyltransferase
MRIISGKFKSRKLIAPKGDVTRPTSDRARESLFNVLQNMVDFEGMNVLDLFAGSGAFAFEAISRGANHATLVEQNRKVVEAMKENARALKIEPKVEIIQKEVYSWLNSLTPDTKHMRADIILADPPYDDPKTLETLPAAIFGSRLLNPGSLVIVEHRKGSHIGIPANTILIKELQAGEAMFTILGGKES